MQLYRAVSPAELADLQRDGQFRACPHSCDGKHFAFSLADARK